MAQICKRTTRTVAWLAAATLLAACDSEHSSNPLSPNIAGPLAGITISAPLEVEPVDGQLLAVEAQPVTLTFENAVSDSPRPFWHELQIAEDGAFEHILDTFEEIPPGEDGVASFELPRTLDPERLYHWRVRAVDGANDGPYSTGEEFEIYTPLTIGAPTLTAPPDGATTQIDAPVLSVSNATLDGPASDVVYRFEISPTQSFSSLTTLLSVPPSAGPTTSAKPGGLGYDLTYYWRAQVHAAGRTGNVVGPYSATWSFRTPPPPVVLGIPVPASPDGSTTTPTTRPTYIINNGTVSGPAGTVTYQVHVATDAGFVMIVRLAEPGPLGRQSDIRPVPGRPGRRHCALLAGPGDQRHADHELVSDRCVSHPVFRRRRRRGWRWRWRRRARPERGQLAARQHQRLDDELDGDRRYLPGRRRRNVHFPHAGWGMASLQ